MIFIAGLDGRWEYRVINKDLFTLLLLICYYIALVNLGEDNMAQTVTCGICHKTVYITDIQNGVDFDKKYLSCGHIQKIDSKDLRETSVVSQLTSSEPVMCSKCNTVYATDSEYLLHYNEKHKPE